MYLGGDTGVTERGTTQSESVFKGVLTSSDDHDMNHRDVNHEADFSGHQFPVVLA